MSKNWYALYVKPRSEKKVALELEVRQIDFYLPLIKVLRQWSDRKKWIEEPLFKSYLFVSINPEEYYEVLKVNGAVRYISFEGKAVPIPLQQIEAIKYYLNEKDPEIQKDADWKKGKKVEIIAGSMTGLIGELVEVSGKHRVSIEIETVGHAILIKIPKNKLRIL